MRKARIDALTDAKSSLASSALRRSRTRLLADVPAIVGSIDIVMGEVDR